MSQSQSDFDAIVQLSGGFGNQLFQYAFGVQLAAAGNRRVGYDIEFFKQPNDVAHNRLRLLDFGFDVPVITARHKNYEAARRLKWLPSPVQQGLFGLTYIKCPSTRYEPVRLGPGLTCFTGLWQSPKYFAAVADEVRRHFRERLTASAAVPPDPRPGVVGFHVRRGDYLTHKQSENIDYAAYLSAALAKLDEAAGPADRLVSVYSDDPDWCEANLSAPRIEISRASGMLDDFLGLMSCEHKIISNSTFAWWAAFLGETGGSLTLAPDRWHAGVSSRDAQILADGWLPVTP